MVPTSSSFFGFLETLFFKEAFDLAFVEGRRRTTPFFLVAFRTVFLFVFFAGFFFTRTPPFFNEGMTYGMK